ncbi:hypothetical protein [Streptomyces sp. NPDC059176]|uniref:hypothetical protein n=1 Tax=unclassified Streptomyces TaxID=2593676 RepID=UPI0036B39624
MSRFRSRWSRVTAATGVLAAVLVAVLLCTGRTVGTDSAAATDTGTRLTAAVAPAHDAQVHQGTPGCRGSQDDGGLGPATPPRGPSAHELLPSLQGAHVVTGCGAVDGGAETVLERGPPPVAAPSPVSLSVLRV